MLAFSVALEHVVFVPTCLYLLGGECCMMFYVVLYMLYFIIVSG